MHDLGTFFAMGGYAAFVWPAYGLTAVTLVLIVAMTVRGLKARRQTERDLAAAGKTRRARREAQQS